jgi:hypothetical protein
MTSLERYLKLVPQVDESLNVKLWTNRFIKIRKRNMIGFYSSICICKDPPSVLLLPKSLGRITGASSYQRVVWADVGWSFIGLVVYSSSGNSRPLVVLGDMASGDFPLVLQGRDWYPAR